jgi:hypothetical protein
MRPTFTIACASYAYAGEVRRRTASTPALRASTARSSSAPTSAGCRPAAGAIPSQTGMARTICLGACSAPPASASSTQVRNGGSAARSPSTTSCQTTSIPRTRSRCCPRASTSGHPTSYWCASPVPRLCFTPVGPSRSRTFAAAFRLTHPRQYNAKLHIDEGHPYGRDRVPGHLEDKDEL